MHDNQPQRRVKSSGTTEGMQNAIDISYNRQVGGLKTLNTNGQLIPHGDCSAEKNVDIGQLVAFYNDGAATVWVQFGSTAGVAAPTGGANSLPVPPKQLVIYSAGNNNFVKASAACFAYLVEDDTRLSQR